MRDWTNEYKSRGAQPLVIFPHQAFQVAPLVPRKLAGSVLLDPASTVSASYGVAFQLQFREGTLPWSARPSLFIVDRQGVLRCADDYEDRDPLWTPLDLLDDLKQQDSLIAALGGHARYAEAADLARAPLGPGTASAVPALVEALADERAQVRRGAAAALYWIASRAGGAVAALAEALDDRDAEVRRLSALALGRIGSAAEAELVTALRHDDQRVRVVAARSLTSYPAPGAAAIHALIRASRDESLRARIAAVRSLVRLPLPLRTSKPVLDALARALTDSTKPVKHDAAYGLQAIKAHVKPAVPTIARALAHPQERARVWGAIVLRSLGPDAEQATDDLIQNAIYDSGNPRNRARDALLSIGTPATSALLELLAEGEEAERAGAANVLGYNHPSDQRVVPALVRSLGDASSQVRAEAAAALGQFGAEASGAASALTKAQSDQDEKTRRAAAEALRRINEARQAQ